MLSGYRNVSEFSSSYVNGNIPQYRFLAKIITVQKLSYNKNELAFDHFRFHFTFCFTFFREYSFAQQKGGWKQHVPFAYTCQYAQEFSFCNSYAVVSCCLDLAIRTPNHVRLIDSKVMYINFEFICFI